MVGDQTKTGWRYRSPEAMRKRLWRALGNNKYGIAFSPNAAALMEVPPEFKDDMKKMRDVKIQKAIREAQSCAPANTLREASLRAWRSGAVSRETLDDDSRATRGRNKASHCTSPPQAAYADRIIAHSSDPPAGDGADCSTRNTNVNAVCGDLPTVQARTSRKSWADITEDNELKEHNDRIQTRLSEAMRDNTNLWNENCSLNFQLDAARDQLSLAVSELWCWRTGCYCISPPVGQWPAVSGVHGGCDPHGSDFTMNNIEKRVDRAFRDIDKLARTLPDAIRESGAFRDASQAHALFVQTVQNGEEVRLRVQQHLQSQIDGISGTVQGLLKVVTALARSSPATNDARDLAGSAADVDDAPVDGTITDPIIGDSEDKASIPYMSDPRSAAR